jgi:hypothetical protein
MFLEYGVVVRYKFLIKFMLYHTTKYDREYKGNVQTNERFHQRGRFELSHVRV